jgi:hypothetical protein
LSQREDAASDCSAVAFDFVFPRDGLLSSLD